MDVRKNALSHALQHANNTPMEPPNPFVALMWGARGTVGRRVLHLFESTAEVHKLRLAHPLLTAAVSEAEWKWMSAEVRVTEACVARFTAAWPYAACMVTLVAPASLNEDTARRLLSRLPPSVVRVKLADEGATDAVVAALPPTLTELDVTGRRGVTEDVSFSHLPKLHTLHYYNF